MKLINRFFSVFLSMLYFIRFISLRCLLLSRFVQKVGSWSNISGVWSLGNKFQSHVSTIDGNSISSFPCGIVNTIKGTVFGTRGCICTELLVPFVSCVAVCWLSSLEKRKWIRVILRIIGSRQPNVNLHVFCHLIWIVARLSIVTYRVIARLSNILFKIQSSYIPCGSISSYRPWLLLLFVRYILMMYMSSRVNLRFSLQWEFPYVEHRSGLPKRQRKPERFSWTFFQFF